MKNFLHETDLTDAKMTGGEMRSVGFEESKAVFKAANFLLFLEFLSQRHLAQLSLLPC